MIEIPMQSQKDGIILGDGIEYNQAVGYELIDGVHNFYMAETGINHNVIDIFMTEGISDCEWNSDFSTLDAWDTSQLEDFTLIDGKLRFNGNWNNQKLFHKAFVSNDFDVQIEYELENVLEDDIDPNILYFIFYNIDNDQYAYIKHHLRVGEKNPENFIEVGSYGMSSPVIVNFDAAFGTFRIKRVGSAVSFYHNDILIYTAGYIDQTQLQIWHLAYIQSYAYIDNFQFISGCPAGVCFWNDDFNIYENGVELNWVRWVMQEAWNPAYAYIENYQLKFKSEIRNYAELNIDIADDFDVQVDVNVDNMIELNNFGLGLWVIGLNFGNYSIANWIDLNKDENLFVVHDDGYVFDGAAIQTGIGNLTNNYSFRIRRTSTEIKLFYSINLGATWINLKTYSDHVVGRISLFHGSNQAALYAGVNGIVSFDNFYFNEGCPEYPS